MQDWINWLQVLQRITFRYALFHDLAYKAQKWTSISPSRIRVQLFLEPCYALQVTTRDTSHPKIKHEIW